MADRCLHNLSGDELTELEPIKANAEGVLLLRMRRPVTPVESDVTAYSAEWTPMDEPEVICAQLGT